VKLAWSHLAKAELQEIRRSSVQNWGHDVAQRYLEDIQAAVKQLAHDPLRAKPLKGPIRILRIRSHYVIVHIDTAASRLTIARVLHVAMDIERHLP
jgi:plasmid stabilization system protein ParE